MTQSVARYLCNRWDSCS